MSAKTVDGNVMDHAAPLVHHHAPEIQPYGHLVRLPIALSESACRESVEQLNQLLADTATLRDLYKKHHWQVAGPTFYQLHVLFDKHAGKQHALVDALAERVQMLGGVSLAMGADIAEMTQIPRPPKGRDAFSGSSLRVDIARISANAPKVSGASGASAPPAIITSAYPSRICRNASPIAIVPDAQLMEFVEFGPIAPSSMAMLQLAAPPNTARASVASTARSPCVR